MFIHTRKPMDFSGLLSKENLSQWNKMLQDIQDGLVKAPESVKEVVSSSSKFPYADICLHEANGNVLHIELAAAGFGPEDITVEIEDDLLIIKGSAESMKEDDIGMTYIQKQIAKRDFVSKFKLKPEYAQSELVDVSSENGILTVSIWPVEEAKPKTRTFVVS